MVDYYAIMYIQYLLLLCEIVIHSLIHNIYTGLMRLIFFISRLIKKGSHL